MAVELTATIAPQATAAPVAFQKEKISANSASVTVT